MDRFASGPHTSRRLVRSRSALLVLSHFGQGAFLSGSGAIGNPFYLLPGACERHRDGIEVNDASCG